VRCRPSVWKRLQKKNEKEKTALNWCTIFHWQKARNNARPPDTTKLQMKSNIVCNGSYVWLVLTRFWANRDCLLKLYIRGMSVGFFPSTRGFFQNFSRGVKCGEFCFFSHSKLRKQPFLIKFSKSRGAKEPLALPSNVNDEGLQKFCPTAT